MRHRQAALTETIASKRDEISNLDEMIQEAARKAEEERKAAEAAAAAQAAADNNNTGNNSGTTAGGQEILPQAVRPKYIRKCGDRRNGRRIRRRKLQLYRALL